VCKAITFQFDTLASKRSHVCMLTHLHAHLLTHSRTHTHTHSFIHTYTQKRVKALAAKRSSQAGISHGQMQPPHPSVQTTTPAPPLQQGNDWAVSRWSICESSSVCICAMVSVLVNDMWLYSLFVCLRLCLCALLFHGSAEARSKAWKRWESDHGGLKLKKSTYPPFA
jgi:Flp pilus assembly protein TadB